MLEEHSAPLPSSASQRLRDYRNGHGNALTEENPVRRLVSLQASPCLAVPAGEGRCVYLPGAPYTGDTQHPPREDRSPLQTVTLGACFFFLLHGSAGPWCVFGAPEHCVAPQLGTHYTTFISCTPRHCVVPVLCVDLLLPPHLSLISNTLL